MFDGGAVRGGHQVGPGDRFEQEEVAGLACGACSPVTRPVTTRAGRSGPSTRSVQPLAGCTAPSGVAADSSARATVVPTATTRPPAARALATRRAVAGGTSKRSGVGGSGSSGLETPACRTIGATVTPRATNRTTNGVVKGRAALAISALPGCVPNTVW